MANHTARPTLPSLNLTARRTESEETAVEGITRRRDEDGTLRSTAWSEPNGGSGGGEGSVGGNGLRRHLSCDECEGEGDGETSVMEAGAVGNDLNPTPYTLHPTPYTLHPKP